MSPLRILIVDDNEMFRRSLASFLNAQANVEIVGEAADGNTAVAQAERLHPDLALIGLNMSLRSSLDAMRDIKKRVPGTKVVVLSMHPSEIYRRKADEAHADGYIEKSSLKQGLLRWIQTDRSSIVV